MNLVVSSLGILDDQSKSDNELGFARVMLMNPRGNFLIEIGLSSLPMAENDRHHPSSAGETRAKVNFGKSERDDVS